MIHKLEVDSIQLEFALKRVLSDIYFKCETGKITGLLGVNGSGKSCLMNIVYGSLSVPSKSIRFDDVPIYEAFKRSDLLVYLPQFNFIPKFLTVKRVFLDFNLIYNDFVGYFPEMEGIENSKIGKLSGGQMRLVEVYVILKAQSQFSMLDEPFSHLMPLQVEKVKEILVAEKVNKGFLITDHLFQQILDICDNLYVLANGKMHGAKTIDDIQRLGYLRL
jgi:ABC-type multidrug transport system ATPase subunit